jgi:hypothetical protein
MARKSNKEIETIETIENKNNLYLALTSFKYRKKIYLENTIYSFDDLETIEYLVNKNLIKEVEINKENKGE